MSNLLSLQYWFNLNPGPFLPGVLRVGQVAIGLLLVAGVIAWIFIKKNEKDFLIQRFWQKLQFFCFAIGIVTLLLVLARQQRVSFLSMPFLLFLVFIGALIWIFFIIKYLTKTLPKKRDEKVAREEKEKYFNK